MPGRSIAVRFFTWLKQATLKPQVDLIKEFSLVLVARKSLITARGFDAAVLEDTIYRLAAVVVEKTNVIPTKPSRNLYSYSYALPAGPDFSAALGLLDFCAKFTDSVALANSVLLRLLPPPSGIEVTDWITKYLMEFVLKLDTRLQTMTPKQGLTHVPYANFCTAVTRAFLTQVLKPRPADFEMPSQLKNFGCSSSCPDCAVVRKFFTLDVVPTTNIAKVQSVRTHLERELAKTKAFGIGWVTIKQGSPYRLQVC